MTSTQAVPTSPTASRAKKPIVVTAHPKLDLESYLGNYAGRTRLERLHLIGTCSTVLGIEALKMGVREAKEGKDLRRYLELQTLLELSNSTEPEATRDTRWMDRTDKQNNLETHRLEAELKGYKQNIVKESIRMANEELGKHFQAIGEMGKSFEAFSRMRQDVSIPKHTIDVARHLIEVAIEQKNWLAVTSNSSKIRMSLSTDEDKMLLPIVCVSEGLAHLYDGDFQTAALRILETPAGMAASFNTVASPNDVAVYGGLCAMATMDRHDLQKKVLENSSFRTYLEMEPHIRRAITFFVNSRYTSCLSILEDYRADYLLDIHLQKHVDEIYQLIRSKSIVQYFIPFSCVTLDSLNAAFASPGKTIDKELVQMIQHKDLDARIDTQNRLLTSTPSAPRVALQASALKAAKDYEREARRRIQHMNIYGADLHVPTPRWDMKGNLGYMDLESSGGGRELKSNRHF